MARIRSEAQGKRQAELERLRKEQESQKLLLLEQNEVWNAF
jgi:hypothetical protein